MMYKAGDSHLFLYFCVINPILHCQRSTFEVPCSLQHTNMMQPACGLLWLEASVSGLSVHMHCE